MKRIFNCVAMITSCSFILMLREACSEILKYNKGTDILSIIMTTLFCICVCVFIRKGVDEI